MGSPPSLCPSLGYPCRASSHLACLWWNLRARAPIDRECLAKAQDAPPHSYPLCIRGERIHLPILRRRVASTQPIYGLPGPDPVTNEQGPRPVTKRRRAVASTEPGPRPRYQPKARRRNNRAQLLPLRPSQVGPHLPSTIGRSMPWLSYHYRPGRTVSVLPS